MRKRASSLLLTVLFLLSLSACGSDGGSSSYTFLPTASNDAFSAVIPGPGDSSQGDVSQPPENVDQNAPDGNDIAGQNGAEGNGNVDPNIPEGNDPEGNRPDGKTSEGNKTLDENGWYTSKDEVALYIHLYGELPDNYVTKDEAEDAGWRGGNVERYTGEGTAIGGSRFGNREGLLPKEKGRVYTECDIDTPGSGSRGAKRIVFSNDGLVYYTDDHYESFELLYGEP